MSGNEGNLSLGSGFLVNYIYLENPYRFWSTGAALRVMIDE
jgi:hypothetical protein